MSSRPTTRPPAARAARRNFLGQGGRLGLLGLAAASAGAVQVQTGVTAEAAPATSEGDRGYQETERVRTYYRLARY